MAESATVSPLMHNSPLEREREREREREIKIKKEKKIFSGVTMLIYL